MITEKEVLEYISRVPSKEDLKIILDAVIRRKKQLIENEVIAMKPGTRVQWTYKGRKHTGTVEKANKTTVNIKETDGTKWRISPTFLTVIPDKKEGAQ